MPRRGNGLGLFFLLGWCFGSAVPNAQPPCSLVQTLLLIWSINLFFPFLTGLVWVLIAAFMDFAYTRQKGDCFWRVGMKCFDKTMISHCNEEGYNCDITKKAIYLLDEKENILQDPYPLDVCPEKNTTYSCTYDGEDNWVYYGLPSTYGMEVAQLFLFIGSILVLFLYFIMYFRYGGYRKLIQISKLEWIEWRNYRAVQSQVVVAPIQPMSLSMVTNVNKK